MPTFADIPAEIINAIIEFLPIDKRIQLLKCKYSYRYIRDVLKRLPYTKSKLKLLIPCAILSRKIVKEVAHEDSVLFDQLGSNMAAINVLCKNFSKESKYIYYYQNSYIDLIVSALKHYSRIYTDKNKYVIDPHLRLPCGSYCTQFGLDKHRNDVEANVLKLFINLEKILGNKKIYGKF